MGRRASFVRSFDKHGPMFVYPGDESQYIILKGLASLTQSESHKEDTSSESESEMDEPRFLAPQPSSSLPEMIHTALKIRMDAHDTPGHSAGWGGIDEAHVRR